MPGMDGSAKPPQISEMFQKFALAFKTKTIEFFAEEDEDDETLSLLDSNEEIITGQRVVVLKPDYLPKPTPPILTQSQPQPPQAQAQAQAQAQVQAQAQPQPQPQQQEQQHLCRSISNGNHQGNNLQALIPSLFATISNFEASYLHFQTAHAPFDADNIKAADRAAVSHLQDLSELKQSYRSFCKNPTLNPPGFPLVSPLEAQVKENQNLLRGLEMVVNRLQSDIDLKDAEVYELKQKLERIQKSNLRLSKRLSSSNSNWKTKPNSWPSSSFVPASPEVMLSAGVFDSVLKDACRSSHSFTKLLIDLMNKAGWDLDLAANSLYSDVKYAKRGHNRYAFLSYVCLLMFEGFDSEDFGLEADEDRCNGVESSAVRRKKFLRQFVEHGTGDAMELLGRDPSSDFAIFCDKKYQKLVHPTMESSLFRNMEENEVVLDSWRSSSVFYESFVTMASSIWMLHKLAFAFDPVIEIFQVERGDDFSMVYMENVTRKAVWPGKTRPKVGFTVIPGFRIGRTVIQSQVYLVGMRCAEQVIPHFTV
ncbi:protein GRAVITROPIC IN THE LIGHT 1-like [Macadamia integrifolia]|uniref:protein GRAVITROPIC IN THE LIGHT 1-like n=1 Tax=Macadamia integrifolia TaxID=60698 RepID=UPI001C4F833C|nr:protein GRAVITROPIC IN THE LIGHT 1-like [Macadamia integrifolia]